METETSTRPLTNKRGGNKTSPIHWGMLAASTILLTLAGVFLIMNYIFLGLVMMLAGMAVRVIDTRQ